METSFINKNTAGITKYIFPALLIFCTICFAGCHRPSANMRTFAGKFLDGADMTYADLVSRQAEIKRMATSPDKKDANVDASPAFHIVFGPVKVLNMFKIRESDYKWESKEEKKSEADVDALKQLAAARDAFAQCALRLNFEVKDQLPAYRVWQNAPPEKIMEKVRENLGIKGKETPPANACERYESLADEMRNSLGLESGKAKK